MRFTWTARMLLATLSLSIGLGAYTVQRTQAHPKVLYITFDDGPGAITTPKILGVLRKEHVHATFFVLGSRCEQLPAIVRRIQHDGHEIGNHGYDHRNLMHQSASVVASEIRMADSTITRITGKRPLYYRPTYGGIDEEELPAIRHMGHPIALWTVDSRDWQAKSVPFIVNNVETTARPGSIILFHDGLSTSLLTAKALPAIIHYYRARGYTFRTL